jgi:hypothetical protein
VVTAGFARHLLMRSAGSETPSSMASAASSRTVASRRDFEEGSVAAVVGRYDNYVNSSGMTLVTDRPASSSGTHALELTAGGSNPATHIYKSFGAGHAELYFRYYAKYVGAGPWHHTGLWIGGSNPPLLYPYPRAGQRPTGNDLFSIGVEPIPTFANVPMDFYTYWMGMQSWMSAPTGGRGLLREYAAAQRGVPHAEQYVGLL